MLDVVDNGTCWSCNVRRNLIASGAQQILEVHHNFDSISVAGPPVSLFVNILDTFKRSTLQAMAVIKRCWIHVVSL